MYMYCVYSVIDDKNALVCHFAFICTAVVIVVLIVKDTCARRTYIVDGVKLCAAVSDVISAIFTSVMTT